MAAAGSSGMGTITKLVIGVTTTLVVVFGGLVGMVFARNAMPTAQESGDRVRAAAALSPESTNAAQAQAPAPSPVSAPPELRTTTPAALTPAASVPAATEQVRLEAESQTAATAAAAGPIDTSRLFAGAIAAPGARAKPSVGGIRLATSGRGPLAGTVIVVDAGHNGVNSPINNRQVPDGAGRRKACNTTGTETNAGYTEHAHNWAVATRLAAVLKARGASVVLTRPDDRGVGPCVDQRAAIGNAARANLVLSIHADGAAAASRGFHVIRSTRMAGGTDTTAASARLATIVRDGYAKTTGRPRSTYLGAGTAITPRGDIAGMNLSRVPAVMLEAGNMRNAAEAALLRSPAFQDKEAYALAGAAQTFLRR